MFEDSSLKTELNILSSCICDNMDYLGDFHRRPHLWKFESAYELFLQRNKYQNCVNETQSRLKIVEHELEDLKKLLEVRLRALSGVEETIAKNEELYHHAFASTLKEEYKGNIDKMFRDNKSPETIV